MDITRHLVFDNNLSILLSKILRDESLEIYKTG